MAFFLEALLGGLMAGMLYALVALGFVLIFKASGVFNFAQGAMVLFAALAMARFSEWIPGWLGIEDKFLGNLMAFVLAAAIMYVLAWLIERLVLRHLVNQEGVTLLMATLGITYFLDGLGQTIFGSDIYKIDVGMPKDPVFLLDSVFPGGVLVNLGVDGRRFFAAARRRRRAAGGVEFSRGLPRRRASGGRRDALRSRVAAPRGARSARCRRARRRVRGSCSAVCPPRQALRKIYLNGARGLLSAWHGCQGDPFVDPPTLETR